MNLNYLDFEQPVAELQQKIEELRHSTAGSEVSLTEEIARLEQKSKELTEQVFANLTPWQVAQMARHPHRPYALDYIKAIIQLAADRPDLGPDLIPWLEEFVATMIPDAEDAGITARPEEATAALIS